MHSSTNFQAPPNAVALPNAVNFLWFCESIGLIFTINFDYKWSWLTAGELSILLHKNLFYNIPTLLWLQGHIYKYLHKICHLFSGESIIGEVRHVAGSHDGAAAIWLAEPPGAVQSNGTAYSEAGGVLI